MQVSKRSLIIATAASLFASGRLRAPHSDEKHPARPGPVKKEQKNWALPGIRRSQAKRSIDVGMSDTMRFTPDTIAVETVRFVARNDGKQLHEFVIGTKAENEKHAALMLLKFPNMEHDEPYMAHVPTAAPSSGPSTAPGSSSSPAPLIAGHYQAGMVGAIAVSAA